MQDSGEKEENRGGQWRTDVFRQSSGISPAHLVPAGGGQDKGGEDGQLVLGVQGPALHRHPHGQTEDGHGLGQGEGLQVLLRVPADQTCSTEVTLEALQLR